MDDHHRLLQQAVERRDEAFETIGVISTAVWDAVRADVFRLLPNPGLRARLASHFEAVARLNVAHEYRSQRFMSRWGHGLIRDPSENEAAVHTTLRNEAASYAETATTLAQELRALAATRAAT